MLRGVVAHCMLVSGAVIVCLLLILPELVVFKHTVTVCLALMHSSNERSTGNKQLFHLQAVVHTTKVRGYLQVSLDRAADLIPSICPHRLSGYRHKSVHFWNTCGMVGCRGTYPGPKLGACFISGMLKS